MATSKFHQIIGVFCMLYAMNTLSIPIFIAQSADVNFSFNESNICNTSDILCVNDAIISEHKIHLTNSTNAHYKSTNKTMGRVVYNKTIQLSSLASFSTDIKFVIKYYNKSHNDDEGEGGIAFFMTSKEMAPSAHSAYPPNGLPGNESYLSPKTFGVGFYCFSYSGCYIGTYAAGYLPDERFNDTQLDEPLYNGSSWTARIVYNDTETYLKVSLSNASNSSLPQKELFQIFDVSEYLPENLVIGISASSENSSQTHTILSWSFNSNTKARNSSISSITKAKTRKIIIVATVVALFCLTGAVVSWGLLVIVRKKKRFGSSTREPCEEDEIELGMIVYQGPCRYKLEDLKAGTNNFCETLKLGQGGFGDVYKAVFEETNTVVAVKRISEKSRQGIKEFISEVSIVSRIRHRNLVQLLGWCHEKGQLLLVYEYMPNGSLDKHLFGKGDSPIPILQWCHRYRIALEIACGLLYLHEEWVRCIVHRDVKCSNIMLDSNFNAKLGDFGLARMLENNRLFQTTKVAGTFGYLAPECVITGRTSPESDVYSFGAVALEIATGRRAVDVSLEEHNMRLVEWVWDLYGQGKALEAGDVRLDGEFDEAEMEQLVGIGLWCSHPDPAERPKMSQVVKLLEMEDQVPQLPSALPVPTYAAVEEDNFSVASSFTAGPSEPLASASSQATTSSTSVAVGPPSSTTQPSSSSNSSTLPMVLHFQKQE